MLFGAFRRQVSAPDKRGPNLSEAVPSRIPTLPENQAPRLAQPVRITDQAWPEGTIPAVSIYSLAYNHEKSIRELARLWNVSERRATGMAEKLITDGKLISRVVFARNGKECVIYAPIISL